MIFLRYEVTKNAKYLLTYKKHTWGGLGPLKEIQFIGNGTVWYHFPSWRPGGVFLCSRLVREVARLKYEYAK